MFDASAFESREALLGENSKKELISVDSVLKNEPNKCRLCITNKYILGAALLLSLFAVVGIIVLGVTLVEDNNDSIDNETCYISPACTTSLPPNEDGFTNSTGYSYYEAISGASCCDACLPGTNATVCFDPNGSCQDKTGDGDYDFLLLDEIWIPQFCRALGNAYDPTLSHVTGMQCEYSRNELGVHGLWPNYVDGYPQCCNASGTLKPLDATDVVKWDIYPELQQEWFDPTASAVCSVCYLLNHEWEKHGGCYSPGDPISYFSTGLALQNVLVDVDKQISEFSGSIVNTSVISSLYEKRPNIICDPNDPDAETYLERGIGIFLESQTCWNRELKQIDCPSAFQGAFTYECPDQVLLTSMNK